MDVPCLGYNFTHLHCRKMSRMEEYLDYAVASCPVDCIYWVSREELQARLPWWVLPFLSVFSHAGLSRCWSMPGSTVDWVNLSNRERQKRSVRSRRRRWWKRRDSCLVLFLSCRTEWSHHDLFSHGQREHRIPKNRYDSTLKSLVSFWRLSPGNGEWTATWSFFRCKVGDSEIIWNGLEMSRWSITALFYSLCSSYCWKDGIS